MESRALNTSHLVVGFDGQCTSKVCSVGCWIGLLYNHVTAIGFFGGCKWKFPLWKRTVFCVSMRGMEVVKWQRPTTLCSVMAPTPSLASQMFESPLFQCLFCPPSVNYTSSHFHMLRPAGVLLPSVPVPLRQTLQSSSTWSCEGTHRIPFRL